VKTVALVGDLMDRSRLEAALGEVEFTSDPAAARGAARVIVDFARHGDAVADVRAAAPSAFVVAFGPHEEEAAMADARAAGADVALSRARFFRDPRSALEAPAP